VRMNGFKWLVVLSLAGAVTPAACLAQARIRPDQPDMQIDAATKSAMLASPTIARLLHAKRILPPSLALRRNRGQGYSRAV